MRSLCVLALVGTISCASAAAPALAQQTPDPDLERTRPTRFNASVAGGSGLIQTASPDTLPHGAAAVGAWSGLGGVAGAIGPFVGGGLVDGPGWRWAFLINVPVAAIVPLVVIGLLSDGSGVDR